MPGIAAGTQDEQDEWLVRGCSSSSQASQQGQAWGSFPCSAPHIGDGRSVPQAGAPIHPEMARLSPIKMPHIVTCGPIL